MAFGQQVGPPASARQLQELAELVRAAGHEGFREARHPLGLTQRQAGGKFTRAEADELISRLQPSDDGPAQAAGAPSHNSLGSPRVEAAQKVLRVLPAEQLAFELERRGWTVIPP
jgi:sensor domain CHASE-containing protein